MSVARAVALLTVGVTALAAQTAPPQTAPAPKPIVTRLTNAGVVRANAQVDSVFISKTSKNVVIDVGDFTAYLLARIGVLSFPDSTGFRVTSDSALVRISGRILDFPAEKRKELSALMFFVDSTSKLEVEISMPQSDYGIMRFRLERILLDGFSIPDVIMVPVLLSYSKGYKELTADGREFQVGMPSLGKSLLQKDQIRLFMRPAPTGKP